ncbi:MAG: T9SS type A sorting domain-containing protein [Bacteroidetes bacterium]|nr:T9SS type A sorting domain-containing protein [Bacteroidota bacterium]
MNFLVIKKISALFFFKTLFLIAFSFISYFSFSQQIYFNNRYDFQNTSWNGGLGIVAVNDGYIICGSAGDTTSFGYYRTTITKIDTLGVKIWDKSYGKSGYDSYSGYPIKTIDGNFAIGNSFTDYTSSPSQNKVQLIKFDSNGDTLWTKKYGSTNIFYAGYMCKQKSNGTYVITGAKSIGAGNDNVLLIKTDSDGNKIWEKNYGGAAIDYGWSVDICNDGGYIIGGFTSSYGAGDYDTYIIKTDSTGNFQWQKTFGGSYFDNPGFVIASANDSSYVIACGLSVSIFPGNFWQSKPRIIKIDNSGNLQWSKLYGPARYGATLCSIRELQDGSYIVAGQTADTNGTPQGNGFPDGIVIKTSAIGDSIWYRMFDKLSGNQSQNYLRDLLYTTDGGIVSCGFTIPASPDTGTEDTWLIKLDGCGCLFANCDTACSVTGIPEIENANSITVFPNPTSNLVNFYFNLPLSKEQVNLIMYDMNGKKVKDMSGINYEKEKSINISDLPNGLYFYSLHTSKTIINGKIIIQH